MMISMIDVEEARVAFEFVIILMVTIPTMLQATANTLVTEEAILAPVVMIVAGQARKEVGEAA